jgi:hypothetical protein
MEAKNADGDQKKEMKMGWENSMNGNQKLI